MNPIQLSEIRAYIDLYGEPSMGVVIFEELIAVMDEHVKGFNGNDSSSRR